MAAVSLPKLSAGTFVPQGQVTCDNRGIGWRVAYPLLRVVVTALCKQITRLGLFRHLETPFSPQCSSTP